MSSTTETLTEFTYPPVAVLPWYMNIISSSSSNIVKKKKEGSVLIHWITTLLSRVTNHLNIHLARKFFIILTIVGALSSISHSDYSMKVEALGQAKGKIGCFFSTTDRIHLCYLFLIESFS